MINIVAWIVFGSLFLFLLAAWWRAINEGSHLTYYAGELLLSDEIRQSTRGKLEQWIKSCEAKDANDLSIRAGFAIRNLANQLAAGDPKNALTSSLFGFRAMLWKRKEELEASGN